MPLGHASNITGKKYELLVKVEREIPAAYGKMIIKCTMLGTYHTHLNNSNIYVVSLLKLRES